MDIDRKDIMIIELMRELKATRRAIRAIKRETNQFDYARRLCIDADKRATKTIIKFSGIYG